jgi:lactate dehydrogenase-like 2-hydroxyacid dehydrogenase
MNTPGGNTAAAAELTMAHILGLSRNIPQACIAMKVGMLRDASFALWFAAARVWKVAIMRACCAGGQVGPQEVQRQRAVRKSSWNCGSRQHRPPGQWEL